MEVIRVRSLGPAFVHPAVQVAEVGTSTTFTCSAVNVPSQSFTWYTNFYGQSELLINSSGSRSSELTIKGVSLNSSGYYVGKATANVDQPTTARGFLQVLGKVCLIIARTAKMVFAKCDHSSCITIAVCMSAIFLESLLLSQPQPQ